MFIVDSYLFLEGDEEGEPVASILWDHIIRGACPSYRGEWAVAMDCHLTLHRCGSWKAIIARNECTCGTRPPAKFIEVRDFMFGFTRLSG